MRRAGVRLIRSVGLCIVLTLLWGTAVADFHKDPRNESEEFFEAQNGARCYSCHAGDDFDPMEIGLVRYPRELPVGETYTLQVRVRQPGPMAHDLREIAVVVNLTQAPNVAVIDESFIEDVRRNDTVRVGPQESIVGRFNLSAGVERVRVALRAVTPETLDPVGLGSGKLAVMITNEEGLEFESTGDRREKVLERHGAEARRLGTGEFYVAAMWTSDVDPETEAVLEVEVDYARLATEHRIRLDGVKLYEGDATTIEVPIRFLQPGPAMVDLRVEAVTYFEHLQTTPNPRNDGLYYRFLQLPVIGGERAVVLDGAFAPTPIGPSVDLYNLFARIVGFVTLILVPVALVTGGVFGKGSRRALNRWVGGPKRRVLWHMSMSWFVILLASMHFVLALVEARLDWTKGLFWGGVGWALLVTLGFTGYYQTRIIKRWGYGTWRQVHLWPAIGVLSFGVVHMALDGSDLGALRDLLPGSDRLSWP